MWKVLHLQHYHVLTVWNLCICFHHLHCIEHNRPPPLYLSHTMIPPIYHSGLIRNIYVVHVMIINIYGIQSVVWHIDHPLQITAPNVPMFLYPPDLFPSICHEVEWFFIIQIYFHQIFYCWITNQLFHFQCSPMPHNVIISCVRCLINTFWYSSNQLPCHTMDRHYRFVVYGIQRKLWWCVKVIHSTYIMLGWHLVKQNHYPGI